MDKPLRGVFLDAGTLGSTDLGPLESVLDKLKCHDQTAPDRVTRRCAGYPVVITNKVVFSSDTLAALPDLQLIQIAATGTNNINLSAARGQGKTVCNVPGYSTDTVVQLTINMMLSLANRLPDYQLRVEQGGWQQSPLFTLTDFPITELAGKKLLILGYGAIGQAVAKVTKALGMQILIARLPDRPGGADRVALEEGIAQADVISLHCPLTPATEHLVNADFLARMKPGALLINTARGPIIDEAALAEALRRRQIGGAGLDVLSQEPPPGEHPLLGQNLPNLIVTPHVAWASNEAKARLVREMAANIEAFARGETRNPV